MNPEFACEVTMQPLDRYPQLDAAILFSDILTIPDAMGQGLYFETGEGPRFKKVSAPWPTSKPCRFPTHTKTSAT
jgi:uroporphyrinogen decarboxylase